MNSYKDTVSLQKRIVESNCQITKHPGYIPIILETKDNQLKNMIKKRKLLASRYITVSELSISIRKQLIKLSSSDALFLFINDEIFSGNTMLGVLYDGVKAKEGITSQNEKTSDMFLYITLALENTFGSDLIDNEFLKAVEKANNLKHYFGSKISSKNLLDLYGFYKRVTEGLAKVENKPGLFNVVARQKWEAWEKAGMMSKTKAMTKYIEIVNSLEKSLLI